MKRRYSLPVMRYRDTILRQYGVELSCGEAESQWCHITKMGEAVPVVPAGKSVGLCLICGRKAPLRYKCCSFDCYRERIRRDPDFCKGVADAEE